MKVKAHAQLQAELDAASAALADRQATIERLMEKVRELEHNVEVLRKIAFGPSTERRRPTPADHPQQQFLFASELLLEAEETAQRKGVEGSLAITPPKPRKPSKRRSEFPDHLPQVRTRYELPADQRTCTCGNPLHEIGCESRRELERLEITLVDAIETMKYACRSCEAGVKVAPGPDRPFEKGLLGVGFLAQIFSERFGNHMPYNRLEKKFANEGLSLSRSVLERSMAKCADRLEPIYDLLCKQVRGADVLFTDDTPVTLARPTDREQGSKQGRVWIYLDREVSRDANCYAVRGRHLLRTSGLLERVKWPGSGV